MNSRRERGYSCSLSHPQGISLPPVGQPGRPGVFSGSASRLGPCHSGAGGQPGALGPPTGSRACGEALGRAVSRAGLWPATRATLNTSAVIPRGRFCLLRPHGDPSGCGGFSQLLGMLGTTSRALAGGWGHVASSEEGLARAQCRPVQTGSWHRSSPGRSWGCPLPTGRDTGAQEGGDLQRAPSPSLLGLGGHVVQH